MFVRGHGTVEVSSLELSLQVFENQADNFGGAGLFVFFFPLLQQ